MARTVRVAIIGVGNCANALVQGVEYYKNAQDSDHVPGLMHVNLGGLHIRDVHFSAAFDINATKVGKDLGEAIFAEPNCAVKFCNVPKLGIPVHRGKTLDGIGKYVAPVLQEATGEAVDVASILRETKTVVVINYLPVGSE